MDKNTNDPIDQFINQILDEKKIPGDSPELRPQLVADLRSQLLGQIDKAMISALSSDQLRQFNQMLDNDDMTDEQLQQFFVDQGIDSQSITIKVMMQFRDAYLGG